MLNLRSQQELQSDISRSKTAIWHKNEADEPPTSTPNRSRNTDIL